MSKTARPRVLFVGAFPQGSTSIVGGNLTACRALMTSSFARELDVEPFDSTQQAVPPPPRHRRALLAARRVLVFASRLAKRPKPDVVLLFASSGGSFFEKSLLILLARVAGIPSLLFIRGGQFISDCRTSRVFRAIAGVLLQLPKRVLCQGPSWQRFYEATFGLPAERCPIVENGTAPTDYLALGAARIDKPSAKDVLTIVFVGWVETRKGIFDLLEAFSDLLRSGERRARLLVLGEGAALPEAQRLAQDANLMHHVEFAGWRTGDEKRAMIAASDVFVLPSHAEGLPNAMIEAMALALPVVVTPVGSIPDVIQTWQNGVLVPTGDVGSLAGALSRLVSQSTLREQLGAAAWETARVRFTPDAAASPLIEAVRAVVRREVV